MLVVPEMLVVSEMVPCPGLSPQAEALGSKEESLPVVVIHP